VAGSFLQPILDRAARTTLAGIRIVDANGVVVATSRSELGLSLAHREEVAVALEGTGVSLLRERISDEPAPPLRSMSRGQRYRVFVALPVIEHDRVVGAVVLSRTPLDIAKALYLTRRPLIIGAAVLLAVVVIVSTLTSLTIGRPVRALILQAESVSRGEKGAWVPLESPGTLELQRLSEAVAAMARNLEDRADYIRTFASHVSHEFKTPLTAIRGTVELLDDHLDDMSLEERSNFLRNLREASEHLDRLVSRLLDQARADVVRPGADTAGVDAAVQAVARAHAESGLDVIAEPVDATIRVRMAEETLREILSNLLDNARQHGGEAVRVRISTSSVRDRDADTVELVVSDDGDGISEANAAKIFTPFFTTARERGGSGLGLSIVRSLLEAHGGTIALATAQRGAEFRIRLPAAQ
jgi:signal transduction histidine kinase